MPGEPDPGAALIANERAKLTATYLNGLAIAIFGVGGLAPIFSVVLSRAPGAVPTVTLSLNTCVCWIVSAGLHSLGRRFLARLTP